jgi:hypothetical protein
MDATTLSLLAAFLLGAITGVTLFLFGLAYHETNLNPDLHLNHNPALNKELNG